MNTKTIITALIFLVTGVILATGFKILPQAQTEKPGSAAGIEYAPAKWKLWQNGFVNNKGKAYWGYSVEYPRDFEIKSGDYSAGQSYIDENPTQIIFPEDAFSDEKTNFLGAWLSISYSKIISEQECLRPIENPNGAPEQQTETIGNLTFKTQNLAEAGAGNFYQTKLYRTFNNGVCLEVDQTLHTGNIGAYEPGTIKEFDSSQTDKIFNSILKTLSITNKNPY